MFIADVGNIARNSGDMGSSWKPDKVYCCYITCPTVTELIYLSTESQSDRIDVKGRPGYAYR